MRSMMKSLLLIGACSMVMAGCSGNNGGAPGATNSTNTNGNANGKSQATESPANNKTSDEKVELNFYYPVAVGGPITKVVESMTNAFMDENPNITVKPIYTGSYADTMIKTQAAVQGGSPPDVAVLLSTELFTLLDMNAIEPLDEMIAADGGDEYVNDFYPAFMENTITDDKIWGIPFQRSTIVLYYNKEMFKEAGLDPEKAPGTWDELAEYATKLTKDGQWGLEIPSTGFQYWMFQTLALQNGDNVMSQDGKKVFFDTPENVEALQYWADLAKVNKAMPEGAIEWGTVPSDFIEGKTAMMYHTTGNLTNVKNNAKFDFGVSMLPKNKQYGTPTGGGNFYIFKGIDKAKQEAAWKFVKFMTSSENIANWSIETGYVAPRKSAYETEAMKAYTAEFPSALVARDQLEYASAELSTHNNGKVTKIFNDAIQSVLTGSADPAAALKKAQEEADKALEPFNK
ncbi:ABC transporter substrate-binding protein [Paenibacillus sp. J5C_2022]|uniref:ABC transporter substrate-binding protein n=1 Tax=Paenibacillus sp. J5C2022 TaxID=2977129 RepID=UPI0021CE8778|nr:ABC transporter substrate-binding protein [Paenibacillus sp. J5C2022]MCU6711741.1 ABC transporter substrate-binding protein [Paenibacillus sp. J5C2022]